MRDEFSTSSALDEWRELVEPGWVRILRIAVAAIEECASPQTQEQLAPHFGKDTNVIKRPLARARDFGLLDHFKSPKGYWPPYLKADPSWVLSLVRTKPR
jgi:hypothetical protein